MFEKKNRKNNQRNRIDMKLISMTDLVLKVVQTPNINEAICWEQTERRLNKIYEYSLFLKQPLTLGMFVPCDLEGNVLKPPLKEDYRDEEGGNQELHLFNKKTYREAKARVLFKGYVVEYNCVKSPCGGYLDIVRLKDRTIESIIGSDIELTETVIKQLGL